MKHSMDLSMSNLREVPPPESAPESNEAHESGISWAAVVAGALVIAALSLVFLALGAGLGFASVSPWSGSGASASTVGVGAILWLVIIQIVASIMGGYLAGRLRTRWTRIHTDEVFFRDTAHGFLAWALAAVLTSAFLVSAAASMAGIATASNAAASASPNTELSIPMGAYFVDRLFRTKYLDAGNADPMLASQAGRILANIVLHSDTAEMDRNYLINMVAMKTGLSEQEAGNRVSEVVAESQRGLEAARKTAMHISIWTFIALFCGAFMASVFATIGGRQRDHVVEI